jgi:hypothetical protein
MLSEYNVYRTIAIYMRSYHRDIPWRFDMAGNNLSKAQAGMNKAIQWDKGWPDLTILTPRGGYHGLFLEIKSEGTRLAKRDGTPASEHIARQELTMRLLAKAGYMTGFAVGAEDAIDKIEKYLHLKNSMSDKHVLM